MHHSSFTGPFGFESYGDSEMRPFIISLTRNPRVLMNKRDTINKPRGQNTVIQKDIDHLTGMVS